FDDVMNKQREVVYGLRNEGIETDEPRKLVYEIIDEAIPNKVLELLTPDDDGDTPNYDGLLSWINTTFPMGLTRDAVPFEKISAQEAADWVLEKVKSTYQLKVEHEEPSAVKELERYIILNAIDRLWQEHLFAMDSLR